MTRALPVAARATQSTPFTLPLLLLFAGSGCAALLYEIVWFHLLRLVVGCSSVSMAFLLASFMGGMCLGTLLLPRCIGRHRLRLDVHEGTFIFADMKLFWRYPEDLFAGRAATLLQLRQVLK